MMEMHVALKKQVLKYFSNQVEIPTQSVKYQCNLWMNMLSIYELKVNLIFVGITVKPTKYFFKGQGGVTIQRRKTWRLKAQILYAKKKKKEKSLA